MFDKVMSTQRSDQKATLDWNHARTKYQNRTKYPREERPQKAT